MPQTPVAKHRRPGLRLALGLSIAVLLGPAASNQALAIKIVTYNILNYSSGRLAQFKTVLNDVQPDVIVVQEMLNGGKTIFLNSVLNAPDGPGGYTMATFTPGPDTNNALYYRPSVITFGGAADHVDLPTTPRQTDRWRLGLNGYTSDASKFYVYSTHLKAGSDPSDLDKRLVAATLIRNNANMLPAGTNFIYAGDFNIRSSFEGSYQQFVGSQADNDGRAFDPLARPGTWHNNSAFADIHSQSPHSNNSGAPPGAATGGIDDRFDFLLIASSLDDGLGLAFLPGTYAAYANDALHFNKDINDSPTIPEGSTIANALHGASDHLPVVLEMQAPAQTPFIPWLNFGEVLVGDVAELDVTVSNSGDPALFTFVETLEYSFVAPVGYLAPGGTFIDEAGGGGNTHLITMLTGTSGNKSSSLEIINNSPDHPTRFVTLLGAVYERGDVNRDFAVDWADVVPFVGILLDPAAATQLDRRLADMDADEVNNADDIHLLLDALFP